MMLKKKYSKNKVRDAKKKFWVWGTNVLGHECPGARMPGHECPGHECRGTNVRFPFTPGCSSLSKKLKGK